jgi:hypothetical protein
MLASDGKEKAGDISVWWKAPIFGSVAHTGAKIPPQAF